MKKQFVLMAALLAVPFIAFNPQLTPAYAQPSGSLVVEVKSIGKIRLGMSVAQVRKLLGKPDKTLRLRNGLTDDLYRSKKTRVNSDSRTVRDRLEVLYKAGKVVQIEATSPTFRTSNGLSTNSTVAALNAGAFRWRYLVYSYDDADSGWQNFYFVHQGRGLSFEFEGWQENLFRRSRPTTILVHRAGSRPFADVGGALVTDSMDQGIVMSQYDE